MRADGLTAEKRTTGFHATAFTIHRTDNAVINIKQILIWLWFLYAFYAAIAKADQIIQARLTGSRRSAAQDKDDHKGRLAKLCYCSQNLICVCSS